MNKRQSEIFISLVFVLSTRLLLTFYWLSRFGGNWVEGDTARTTVTIQAVLNNGHLISPATRIYPYGFLYQVLGATLGQITGWSVINLQNWLFPFVGIALSFIAFVFYLHTLKKPFSACLATILLNLQGDFILTSIRGTHEKIDFVLIFVALLTLGLSISKDRTTRERIAFAIIYYLIIMAESTTNVFIASTFVTVLVLSFVLWVILNRFRKNSNPAHVRLVYIVMMAIVFVFLVVLVLYPPAREVLFTTRDLAERLRLLFLSNNEPPAELYQVVGASWTTPNAWIFLRVYDITLAITAGLEWLILVTRARKGEALSSFGDYFWLIILLPAFAIQNLAAVLSDITGSSGDINNLEIRLIPLTAFIAAPLAAQFILRIIRRIRAFSQRPRWLVSIPIAFFVVLVLVIGLIKGTSEPLLSNNWIFYSSSESVGLRWLNEFIPHPENERGRRIPLVWIGPDFRLGALWLNNYWGPDVDQLPAISDSSLPFQFIFISPGVRLLTERYHQSLPDLRTSDIIYDVGGAQIYYRPPESR